MKNLFFLFLIVLLPNFAFAHNYTHYSCITKYRVFLVDVGVNEIDQSILIVLKKEGGPFGAETLSFGGWTGTSEISNFQRGGTDFSNGYTVEVQNSQTKGRISLTPDGRMKIDLGDPNWSYAGIISECQLSIQ